MPLNTKKQNTAPQLCSVGIWVAPEDHVKKDGKKQLKEESPYDISCPAGGSRGGKTSFYTRNYVTHPSVESLIDDWLLIHKNPSTLFETFSPWKQRFSRATRYQTVHPSLEHPSKRQQSPFFTTQSLVLSTRRERTKLWMAVGVLSRGRLLTLPA